MPDEALAVVESDTRPPQTRFTSEQVELIKRTIAKGATNDELELFMGVCRRTGLDPFARQVFAIKRWDSREQRQVMSVQVSIDGLRLIAERTGSYQGQDGPYWCGPDGQWTDVWLDDDSPPDAAKVGIYRAGFVKPLYAVARWPSYVQAGKDGEPFGLWAKMPDLMLAKCAEALALRRTFPQELSGVYTSEEMAQAEPEAQPELPLARQAPQADPQNLQGGFKERILAFSKLHARLPKGHDHVYQQVLNQFGVRHSNQFKDRATAVAAYQTLLAKVLELEAAAKPAEVVEDEPEAPHGE